MLTKEQILAANDLQRTKVAVPEWGGDVFVRTLTAADREAWEASVNGPGEAKSKGLIRAAMVVATVCDEQGNLLFDASDADAIAKKSAHVVMRLFDEANRLSRITKEDVDRLEKNSEAIPSDSSVSGSPEN